MAATLQLLGNTARNFSEAAPRQMKPGLHGRYLDYELESKLPSRRGKIHLINHPSLAKHHLARVNSSTGAPRNTQGTSPGETVSLPKVNCFANTATSSKACSIV